MIAHGTPQKQKPNTYTVSKTGSPSPHSVFMETVCVSVFCFFGVPWTVTTSSPVPGCRPGVDTFEMTHRDAKKKKGQQRNTLYHTTRSWITRPFHTCPGRVLRTSSNFRNKGSTVAHSFPIFNPGPTTTTCIAARLAK